MKIAKKLFARNNLNGYEILANRGYGSEHLHEFVRSKGAKLFAPVRKMDKRSLRKKPKGKYRREGLHLPEYMDQRNLVETVDSVLKRKQINCLRSKKKHMKQREFGWQVVLYNLNRQIILYSKKKDLTLIFCLISYADLYQRWELIFG